MADRDNFKHNLLLRSPMLLIAAPTVQELGALLAPAAVSGLTLREQEPVQLSVGERELWGLATGPGLLNASFALGDFLGAHKAPQAVLCAGLAAAFNLSATPLRSVCLVEHEIWPEYGLNDGTHVVARAFSQPLWKRPNGEVIHDTLSLAWPDVINPDFDIEKTAWLEGNSLTVAGVSASFARREFLWNTYHAQLENSEGFAIAYGGARHGIPVVEVRVVSHKAGPRSREEKDTDGAMLTLHTILPELNIV